MAGTNWDETFDVVIVGSGAAGLLSSVVAIEAGLKPLVIEKSEFWGGTSGISGGGLWIPVNPVMLAAGEKDSAEEALRYMDDIIKDVGPASSRERRVAYVTNGPKMVQFLKDKGFNWGRSKTYPDYYPNRPGGRGGRMVEGNTFDGKQLGDWLKTLRSRKNVPPIAFKTDDAPMLPLITRTFAGFARGAKIMINTMFWNITGRTPLASGQSLVGQLMAIALKKGVPVRLNTGLTDLVFENGRVTGVVVNEGGKTRRIAATRAVMLTAGGFSRNAAYRKQFQEVGDEYTGAIESDTGDAIQLAVKAGAATALMDEAWWCPVSITPDGIRMPIVWERQLPHGIMVDSSGQRYMNEAQPYVDAGRDQLERHKIVPAIPTWLILDARHRSRYVFGPALGGKTPQAWIDAGFFVKADTLDELAAKIKIDAAGLKRTVERFNGFADTGVDLDFGRGGNAYDNFYSDPRTKPNPNLGRIEKAPFWATPVVPGDLGTKGGLLTDENARVLREDGGVIQGLYAAGNTTASVMGRTYAGPGATLGPATTFAFIGIRHAAGVNS
jgi:3-oxosteroid 1-dehydrogenase